MLSLSFVKASLAIFSKLKFKLFFLFVIFVIFFTAFGPIFKTVVTTNQQFQQLKTQSGGFDYKIRFLRRAATGGSTEQGQPLTPINQILQKIQKSQPWINDPFSFLWSTDAEYVDFFATPDKKRFLLFRAEIEDQLPNYQQDINNLVLAKGRLPLPNVNEVVVNTKFFNLNNLKIGDKIKAFDRDFTIVGTGNNIGNVFLDFSEILKVKKLLNFRDANLQVIKNFKFRGLLFARRSLFQKLVKEQVISQYRDTIYVKFASTKNKAVLKDRLLEALKANLYLETFKVEAFDDDRSSGFQNSYNDLQLIIFSLVCGLAIIFIIIFIFIIVSTIIKNNHQNLRLLTNLGFSLKKIVFYFFIWHFVLVMLAGLFGFLFGMILDYRLTNLFNDNRFLKVDFEPFHWLYFLILVSLLPAIIGGLFFVFGYLKMLNFNQFLFESHYQNRVLTLSTVIYRKIQQKISFSNSIALKIFNFFLLRDIWKKIVIFFLVIALFTFSFLLTFFQLSSSNHLKNQWNFINKDVKSLTFFRRSTYVNDSGKIKSNLTFMTFDDFLGDRKKSTALLNEFNNLKLNNPACLLTPAGTIDPKTLLSNRCLNQRYLDKNAVIDPEIKRRLTNLNFEKVFFNKAIFDADQELPMLVTDGNIAAVSTGSQKIQAAKVSNYFLTPGWERFFNFAQFVERDPDFKPQNGQFGYSGFGIPYVVVGYAFKTMGYQVGDSLTVNVDINGRKTTHPLTVRIGAFLSAKQAPNPIIFFNYNVLTDQKGSTTPLILKITTSGSHSNKWEPYNFLLTKSSTPNYQRYLAIDLKLSKNIFNPTTEQFNFNNLLLANIRTVTISEMINLSQRYFVVFQSYLSIIFVLSIIFSFFALILAITFLVQTDFSIIQRFKIMGFKIMELFKSHLVWFAIILILGIILGALFAWLAFVLFGNYFQKYGVFLHLYDFWIYILFLLVPMLFLFFFHTFYHYFRLRKSSFQKNIEAAADF